MNTDIRISVSFKGHRKRKKLRRLLGDRSDSYLIDFWITVSTDCPKGVLVGWTPEDIADACCWNGDPKDITDAFLSSGWIDIDENGQYSVHDWDKHQAWACNADKRSEAARAAAKKRWDTIHNKKIKEDESEQDKEFMPGACGAHKNSNAPFLSSPFLSLPLTKELVEHFEKKTQENELQKYEPKFSEFIQYRKSIKKPLKSKQGITGFINLAKKLNDMKLDIEKCFDYTMGKEWQSPPIEFFTKNKKEFKREIESISICLAQDVWENSSYQAGGLYKTSEINYINFMPDFIDDNEREEVEINTARFVAEFCEGGF